MQIGGDENGALRDGLGDQQVIEWVAVMHRQSCQSDKMQRAYRQWGEALCLDRVSTFLDVSLQPADADLDGDFPKRGDTNQYVIDRVFAKLPRPRPDTVIVGQPPKERVRIKEEFQSPSPSIAANTSGGRRANPAMTASALMPDHAEEWCLIEWPKGEADTSLADLIRQGKRHGRIELDYQDFKRELGFGHHEGRA